LTPGQHIEDAALMYGRAQASGPKNHYTYSDLATLNAEWLKRTNKAISAGSSQL
jgi:hypothetical protein